ncbi:MAG TPA: GNAT family N-acetyltransferase [Thermomicrobiaceae bacterium]|nr:GNAT family N-acetyltransferase [Thermomicrobiaceae bacterium]
MTLTSPVTVRELHADELTGVYDIDMTETDDAIYRVDGQCLVLVPEAWTRRPRSRASWDAMVAGWRVALDDGGAAWGAFDAMTMVGVVVLRDRVRRDMAELAALFVSRPYRRAGVARRLVVELLDRARRSGARRVYVSATPSRSAVGFYQSLGFRLADEPLPELFEREPEDVHMVLSLGAVE